MCPRIPKDKTEGLPGTLLCWSHCQHQQLVQTLQQRKTGGPIHSSWGPSISHSFLNACLFCGQGSVLHITRLWKVHLWKSSSSVSAPNSHLLCLTFTSCPYPNSPPAEAHSPFFTTIMHPGTKQTHTHTHLHILSSDRNMRKHTHVKTHTHTRDSSLHTKLPSVLIETHGWQE